MRPDTPIANFSPSNGALNFLTADGKKIDYDSTLAGKYYKRIAEAQGIRLITDLTEYQGMTEKEQNAYLATVNPQNTMVARAVQRTTAFKQDNYQVDQFRTRYMNDSFLTELPGVLKRPTLKGSLEETLIITWLKDGLRLNYALGETRDHS